MRVQGGRPGGIRLPVAALAGPPSPHAMSYSSSARQAEPLLPLAVFLLAPLLLAAGVQRRSASPVPVARAAVAPVVATPVLPSVGGTRGR